MRAEPVARVIDGRAYAEELMEEVKGELAELDGDAGIATLLVGDEYTAQLYQERIDRHAQRAGLRSWMVRLPGSSSLADVVQAIGELERNPGVSGLLVLRPLPPHLDERRVFEALPPMKDVEAQHPENAGLLALGIPRFIPSTPAAAFHMLDRYMTDVGRDPRHAYDGLNLVLVGRSPNVGKPAAILGLARNATVVSAHKHTSDAGRLTDFTSVADLLIVAVGVPGLVTGDMVREGAIVVDIGINAVDGPDGRKRLVGDVDFESVRPRAEAISPVPGGVGPITDVWVLKNALTAAKALRAAR